MMSYGGQMLFATALFAVAAVMLQLSMLFSTGSVIAARFKKWKLSDTLYDWGMVLLGAGMFLALISLAIGSF